MIPDPNIIVSGISEVAGLWPLAAGVVTGLVGRALLKNRKEIDKWLGAQFAKKQNPTHNA